MGGFSQVFGKELIKILERCGFVVTRQTGSHVRLAHSDGRKITIAVHNKSLPLGTLFSILRQAQISKEEFKTLLDSE
ncbi:MAG: addiction module toxin, HicA family [Candidatus Magasanikbacteria bacterium]|nr:addiction module toxin, HicA family [Candidatus Magasanikbacteria bacterium]